MGAAQSIPVVGEAVTAINSGVKMVAAGAYGAVAAITDDEDTKDTALKFLRDAGDTWVEYSERNIFFAPMRALVHDAKGDYKERARVMNKMVNSVGEVADSTPVVGHIKGVYHYIDGDKEHGHKCMTGASRSLVVLGAGAVTGGLGGGIALGGLAGIGGGVGYDGVVSVVQERPYGVIDSVDRAIDSAKEKDLHGYTESMINVGYAVTGDFMAGAGGAEAAKRINKASQQRSALRRGMGKSATKDAVDAAKHLKEVTKEVQGEGHVCTKAKNLETGDKAFGTSERCRQQLRVNEFNQNGKASGYSSKTNAIKGHVDEFPRKPGILETKANDLGIEVEQRVPGGRGGHRAVNACAEHEAFQKLDTTGADNNVRTTSVQYRDGKFVTVERCDNCAQFGDLMGEVPTDRAARLPVPTRQFILDSSARAIGGAAAYVACGFICENHGRSDEPCCSNARIIKARVHT